MALGWEEACRACTYGYAEGLWRKNAYERQYCL